jgi:hypothetical protein
MACQALTSVDINLIHKIHDARMVGGKNLAELLLNGTR